MRAFALLTNQDLRRGRETGHGWGESLEKCVEQAHGLVRVHAGGLSEALSVRAYPEQSD